MDRLQAARGRLRAALLAGEDTTPHRAALALLESQAAKSDEVVVDPASRETIRARAQEIAASARSRVEALLERHPIPVFDHSSEVVDG